MALEDHLGDILRKARQSKSVSESAAAHAAGLSSEAYARLEASGSFDSLPNCRSLALLLGLDGSRLQGIAQGWQPEPAELSRWRELRQITTTRSGNAVHCYLVWDEVSREGALFDTGWEAEPIFALADEHGITLKHLFLTHLHQDHVQAMQPLRDRYPKLLLHTNSKSAPAQHRNRPNDFISLGNLRIMNRDTPGHAEEGVTYVIGNWPEDVPHVAIAGDTIFAGSIATGFQSTELLKAKIREQLLTLPHDTLICPGHGPVTTVREELAHNPFF
jgi:glyoxylase-like metal-dependent hydrolase (beta-lactamase superfamily II)